MPGPMPAPHVNTRIVLLGRAIVLACAAVLSFSALYDLAVLCGFRPWQAALFPIMVDAGVAVSLAGWRTNVFARQLTIALLASTVVGNAVAHILIAYRLQPHWMIVVLVGALAPAVLAATWRLDNPAVREGVPDTSDTSDTPDVQELDVQELEALDQELEVQELAVVQDQELDVQEPDVQEQARRMALEGAGRTVLMRELGPLGLTEYQAKQLLRELKTEQVA